MSHTFSKTWVSDRVKEHNAFIKFRLGCIRIAPKSCFIPQKLSEWIDHRLWTIENKMSLSQKRTSELGQGPKLFYGKKFEDNLSPVLAERTVWATIHPSRALDPWPNNIELKGKGRIGRITGDSTAISHYPEIRIMRQPAGSIGLHTRLMSSYNFFFFGMRPRDDEDKKDADYMAFLIGNELLKELGK
ncbi:hypothetical protein MPDQ_003698 [Monascus purpureus]|uniref:Uncharacterized protein n=1 Tax=Monascus purpureus TaxID=5098 RepID=A0A507QMI1_MONPU|nr:hypothetical protein MPDQ_003698 [Monascus purpureus]